MTDACSSADWATPGSGCDWGDSDDEADGNTPPVRRVRFALCKNEWFEVPRKECSTWGHWSHNIEDYGSESDADSDSGSDYGDDYYDRQDSKVGIEFEMEYDESEADNQMGASMQWDQLPVYEKEHVANKTMTAWGDEDYPSDDEGCINNRSACPTDDSASSFYWDSPVGHMEPHNANPRRTEGTTNQRAGEDIDTQLCLSLKPSSRARSTSFDRHFGIQKDRIRGAARSRSASFGQDRRDEAVLPADCYCQSRSRSSFSVDVIFKNLHKSSPLAGWEFELKQLIDNETITPDLSGKITAMRQQTRARANRLSAHQISRSPAEP